MKTFLLIKSLVLLSSLGLCLSQSEDDGSFHFSNLNQGNAVWIIDESNVPWVGSFDFLRSLTGLPTVLLSVVDSSTGVSLGQCVAPATNDSTRRWESFQWELNTGGLQCIYSEGNPTRALFAQNGSPRTFSVRIQSSQGPACMRDMTVQNEKPVGCPPHLSRNSFTAMFLNCTCPFEEGVVEDESHSTESADFTSAETVPQFPLFKGIEGEDGAVTPQWTLSPSPCANHQCQNNGTCLVSQDGKPTCLCRNGFAGDRCEQDMCSAIPCQNGGVCMSSNGIAFCDCPTGFTGILCESEAKNRQKCNPECSNGDCVEKDGTHVCECRQGFTGSNCNILDVCLGDAACAMFGAQAKCVLDDTMETMNSPVLFNGTYECKCPHPVHGQYIDCIELHAPSPSPLPFLPASVTKQAPAFPVFEVTKTSSTVPTTLGSSDSEEVSEEEEAATTAPTTKFIVPSTQIESQPVPSFRPNPNPSLLQTVITPRPDVWTQPSQPFLPFQPSTPQIQITPLVSLTTTTSPPPPPTTTTTTTTTTTRPITTTTTVTTTTPVVETPLAPTEAVTDDHEDDSTESNTSEEESFPHPNTMDVNLPSSVFTSQTTTHRPASPITAEDYDEDADETETTPTTTVTQSSTTTTVFIEPSTEEESVEENTPETTPQTSLPFWMTSKTPEPETPKTPQAPMVVPHVPSTEEPTSTEVETSNEEFFTQPTTQEPSTTTTASTPTDRTTTIDISLHKENSKQSSAAVSWIIAIIALIVLGLLLLATSLFVLRYIRQSRKLHGKYNPAREEHALSAAYAMPMSHIAKEERLI